MPGLLAWVHSVPSGSGEGGGDVHHVSLCTSCTLSRIALADVSGHGQAVAAVGDQLRVLMHRYLTEDDQSGLMQDLNRAVQQNLEGVHYATMVAAGWNHARGLLVLTNAGHPPPHSLPCRRKRMELDRSAKGTESAAMCQGFRSACSPRAATARPSSSRWWAI